MKIYYSTFLIGLFLLFSSQSFAQIDYEKADFDRLFEAYQKTEKYSVSIDYLLYPTHTAEEAFDKQTASFQRNKDTYRYQLAEIENITNPDWTLMVDYEDKTIFIDKNRKPIQQLMTGMDLEKAFALCSKITSNTLENGLKSYRLEIGLPDVETIVFEIDTKRWLLKKLTLYYRVVQKLDTTDDNFPKAKPRLEMVYHNWNPNPKLTASNFTYRPFLTKRNGKLEPTPKFKSYTFRDFSQGFLNN